jgi:hypothetical protein
MKLLKQLVLITESDKVEGLPRGQELFGQRFVYFGDYNSKAKEIIADKLAGRWCLVVQSLNTGDQGITDRNYSNYVDLGPNGHGFVDKKSAQAYGKQFKKRMEKGEHNKRQYHINFTACKVEDIEETHKNNKPMSGEGSYRGHLGLAYAKH